MPQGHAGPPMRYDFDNFLLKPMDYILKMMNYILRMTDFMQRLM